MKLADVKLSFPHVVYDVTVSHYAPRQATAVEWVILEAIQASTLDPSFRDAPFAAVFEDILSIKDADRLIKPVIFDLVGSGMMVVEGLSDEAPLGKMPMSQFRLTERGQKLRKDGTLPARTMEDVVHVRYDVFKEACEEGRERHLSPEATGIKVIEAESVDDVVFPSAAITGYLESARGRSNNPWLTKETHIQDLAASGGKLLWKNITCPFEVGGDLICRFSGIESTSLSAKVLEQLDFQFTEGLQSTVVTDPDVELNWLDSPKRIAHHVRELLASSNIGVIRADCFDELASIIDKDALRGKALCIPSSGGFSARLENGALLIEVQEDMLSEGAISSFPRETLRIENYELRAGDTTRGATLLSSAPSTQGELESICREVATGHSGDSLLAALPLLALGEEDLFQQIALDALANMKGLAQKSAAIEDVNHATRVFLGSERVSAEVARVALSEELAHVFSGCTFDDIAERVAEVKGDCSLEDDGTILNEAVAAGLRSLPEPSSVAQVWKLWASLDELGIDVSSLDGDIVASLYGDRRLNEIMSAFDSADFYSLKAWTVIERSMLQLRRSCDGVSALLSGSDVYKPLTEEDARLLCIANKGSLVQVYAELKSWQQNLDNLSVAGINLEKAERSDSPFAKASISMKSVSAGIRPFYDESSLRYAAVYVVDTCALMNSPELVETFEDNKALLIVPKVVLDELDGLKSSEDGERALKARDAIRAIDNHRAFDWLNLRENSHPELLPDDCDKDRNDSKILSVAVRYIFKKPVLITDDSNLRNLAEANAVESTGSGDFLKARNESRIKKKRAKKKGGKR